MASTDALLASLNAGEISRLALARVDLAKLRMACEQQQNFLPHLLGPTMVRPGMQYITGMPGNAAGWLGEFYFDETTKALLVATAAGLLFLVGDIWIGRPAVSAAITNGTFNANIGSWTNSDEAGALSDWSAGCARFTGTGTNYAYLDQQVTVVETGTEHALRVVVLLNTVVLRVGTAQGLGDYLDVTLLPGTYSLAFTPSGNFWIRIGANSTYKAYLDSIAVEGPGPVSLPVPWSTTAHFDSIRYDQSGDVLFVASAGFQQRRIERRDSNSRSWGIALYQADDGPFRLGNTSTSIQLTPGATSGSTSLTASRPLFKSSHVGALFRATHSSQTQSGTFGALNAVTAEIRIAGLASHNGSVSSRAFAITIAGTWVGGITLERSIGAPGSWAGVTGWSANTAETYDDTLDNQIIYYRLKMTAYTSGSASVTLAYAGSSQTGICRINSVTNSLLAGIDILKEFGGTAATSDWAEGEWSDYRGWPAAVALHDGRLSWFPGIKAQHSVSDAYASFDDTVIGDSGPINKTVVAGGLDGMRWALSLQRLLVGTAAVVTSIRSNSFDEPLTPTAYVARVCGDDGAAKVRPLRLGKIGIYVGAAKRLFKLAFEFSQGDYESVAIDRLKPEMFAAGIRDMAAQRKPDNAHIWVPLADGTAIVVAHNQKEEVEAMVPVVTDGAIERVAVLPGTDEDDVYFIVQRNVGGVVRYIEKLAKRSECVGGTVSKAAIDAHIVYSGAAVSTITGLGHLEGKSVVVWGKPLVGVGAPQVTADAPLTVSGGQITGLTVALTVAVVGLSATARIKTVKPAYATEHGTALTLRKRIARIGLVMADVAWKGVRVGRDFSSMSGLPATYRGKALTAGQVLPAYDADPACFNGGWDSDSRVCIEVKGPYCATIMGIVLNMTTNEPHPPAPRDGG